MYSYVNDVSNLSHYIIKNFCLNKTIAIDATLGNGSDTLFLSKLFNKVYSFDVQKCAIDNFKKTNLHNLKLINDSHEYFKNYIKENVDCIIYNLGYLPGGDKEITTREESTLKSIKEGLDILSEGGLMIINIYIGHNEGKKEKATILNFAKQLPKDKFGVMLHSFINRNSAPYLMVIEKKKIN